MAGQSRSTSTGRRLRRVTVAVLGTLLAATLVTTGVIVATGSGGSSEQSRGPSDSSEEAAASGRAAGTDAGGRDGATETEPGTAHGGGPEAGESPGLPGITAKPVKERRLLTRPLPESGSAEGGLVRGFPSDVLSKPSWVRVDASSVSSSGSTLQVTLDGGTDRSRAALVEHYRRSLIAAGFAPADAPAVDGGTAYAFSHGEDSVVLTLHGSGGRFSLFAVLHARD